MSCHDELICIACLIELGVHYTESSLLSSTAGYTTVSALALFLSHFWLSLTTIQVLHFRKSLRVLSNYYLFALKFKAKAVPNGALY